MNSPLLKTLRSVAAQPFLTFLVVIGVIVASQCGPVVSRSLAGFAGHAGQPQVATRYSESPAQIQNYVRTMTRTIDGDVALSPAHAVPSLVTVTAHAPMSPQAARKSAAFAWVSLVQIRRERLGPSQAPQCIVRICDSHGKTLAVADHTPRAL